MTVRTPWLHSAALDLPFVLAPPFVLLGLVALFPEVFGPMATFTEWHWLGLVLLIDVAHVYSTIYRTYLDPLARKHYRFELTWLPLLAFVLMVVLHSINALLFWRCMAYLAVFHFVRQQYGFMRLYQRGEQRAAWKDRLDAVVIYAATLAPLLYWHFSYPRSFNWFVPNDMLGAQVPWLASAVLWSYGVLLAAYALSEMWLVRRADGLNLPKNLLLAGTALSWYLGIVHFNGDVTFTLFNVVGHGLPYMALVWAYGRKRTTSAQGAPALARRFFSVRAIPLYLGLLFLLAYVEEGFWDAFVWREHGRFFTPFGRLFPEVDDRAVLSLIVPLLSLPQVTHYIIDAFIWRMRKERDRDGWQAVIFGRSAQAE